MGFFGHKHGEQELLHFQFGAGIDLNSRVMSGWV